MPLDLTRAGSLELSFRVTHLVSIFPILSSPLNLSFLNVVFYIHFRFCLSDLCIKFTLACCEVQVQMISKFAKGWGRSEERVWFLNLVVEEEKLDPFTVKY
jgi:hypothetical protein